MNAVAEELDGSGPEADAARKDRKREKKERKAGGSFHGLEWG